MQQRGSALFDLELKQRMTWRQVDIIAFARVPAAHNQSSRIWIRFDLVNQTRDLIDAVRLWIMPPEGAPEVSINWPKIPGLSAEAPRVLSISPFLPDVHAAGAQIRLVRVAR